MLAQQMEKDKINFVALVPWRVLLNASAEKYESSTSTEKSTRIAGLALDSLE